MADPKVSKHSLVLADFGLIQLRIADLKKRQMSVSILDLKGRLRFSILQLYDI